MPAPETYYDVAMRRQNERTIRQWAAHAIAGSIRTQVRRRDDGTLPLSGNWC